MDDLLIPSRTVEEGIQQLDVVLQLIHKAGVKLNLKKCSFLMDKLEYLGHEITAGEIRPGQRKIQAVSQFPVPKNVHNVRQFLGLASYFRKFIRNFSILARPLTDLTKKRVKWCWEANQNNAFELLKTLLATRPVLSLYDSQAKLKLHTDASSLGLGGVLMQRPSNDNTRLYVRQSKNMT